MKLADLDTLKQAVVEGYVELKYLDESGCCPWSAVSYSYIAVPIQMQYNIISWGVGARQCRAPTGVSHANEKRYSRIGSQKQMAQVGSRGGCISILGLWQPQVSFEYALVQGGFKTTRYIEVMDWVTAKAQNTLVQTGRISVIVHDNCSLHTSKKAKQKWLEWQEIS
ncbi:hypothetical protein [Nostoc sp. 'Lobaria pulmonaria (5183) cyanobiont']|uniref:hypothetical protein n=1 Tax=Nostoc sp. 'Lobaria pulmonaria (5183) cyanobiont' TaxID=1618022 RepID=UPI00131A2697